MKPREIYVLGDLHFGHRRIAEFRPEFSSREHHEEHICDLWRDTVKERDQVWLLGDAAFTMEGLAKLGTLPGEKILVRGNHDELPTLAYMTVFAEVYGIVKYRRKKRQAAWLSHAPVHPDELRGRINIHGHVHGNSIQRTYPGIGADPAYVNVCPEVVGYAPIVLRDLLLPK